MNADEINGLGRIIIQKIAKAEKIAANATTVYIISKLLEKYPEGLPRDHKALEQTSKGLIKVGTIQAALRVARMGAANGSAISAAEQLPAQQPTVERRVTRAMARKGVAVQDATVETNATSNIGTTMTSAMKTEDKAIPTLQSDVAEPGTALSVSSAQKQPEAQGLVSKSVCGELYIVDEASKDTRIKGEVVLVSKGMKANIAPLSPCTDNGSGGLDAALTDIAEQHKGEGTGGAAAASSPSPFVSTMHVPGVDYDHEAEKEVELQRLFAEAKARYALRRHQKQGGNTPTTLRGRPAAPALTVGTSPATTSQEPTDAQAPARRRREISPHTLYNDPRYPWPKRIEDVGLSRNPMADEGSMYDINGYDERWITAAYQVDMASTGSLAMAKQASRMLHPKPKHPIERTFLPGAVTDEEIDRKYDPVPIVLGSLSSPRIVALFEDVRRGPVVSPLRFHNVSVDADVERNRDENEDTGIDGASGTKEDTTILELENIAPKARSTGRPRTLRRAATMTFLPDRMAPSSSFLSRSPQPAESPMRNQINSQRSARTLNRASTIQNLAGLFEQSDVDLHQEREHRKGDDASLLCKWGPSTLLMPPDDFSSPPSSPGLSAASGEWMPQMEGDKLGDWSFEGDRSPFVDDDGRVGTDSDQADENQGEGDKSTSHSPVVGPSNISDVSGGRIVSIESSEGWEEYVQVARMDGTLGLKRAARRQLDDERRKRVRYGTPTD